MHIEFTAVFERDAAWLCPETRRCRASLWTNPTTGLTEAVPRHTEISNDLARKICCGLGVPEVGK